MKGMKSRNISGIVAVMMISLSVPTFLNGQVYYSTLVGTVRDASGAVVPNVELTAIEVSTGVKTPGRTNASGDYRIENLRPGTYTVQATVQGFKQKIVNDILLVLAQTTRGDLSLELGEVSERIE